MEINNLQTVLHYFSDFSPAQLRQLELLGPLYSEWNEKINVISRKDIDRLYEKHVLHSLAIAAVFSFAPGTKIIDIGTGGGFPGIPLAIFFPQVEFLLVDSIGKKIKVVEAVAEAAGISNIRTAHLRAEEAQKQSFDFAVSRAVAPLRSLWQWGKPLLKKAENSIKAEVDGQMLGPGLICLKGGDLAAEISESGLKPMAWEIEKMFSEPFFQEKFVLFVRK